MLVAGDAVDKMGSLAISVLVELTLLWEESGKKEVSKEMSR